MVRFIAKYGRLSVMSNRHQPSPYFVISLDFELMWGMFDKVTEETYGDALRGTAVAIPQMLDLFTAHNIHATWATVGMLATYSLPDLEQLTPLESDRPHYLNPDYSSYEHIRKYKPQVLTMQELYHAPEIVERIAAAPGQEVGSHSFSHCYLMETLDPEQKTNPEYFAHDCLSAQKALERFGVKPVSFVFPRNQWSKAGIDILRRFAYVAYRGTETSYLYRPRVESNQKNLLLRLLRFIDRYVNISGYHAHNLRKLNRRDATLINIPASRMLAPYNKMLFFLERLRLRRVKRSMTKAAKRGLCYHLWWHPHNFGRNQAKNIMVLREILLHFKKLEKQYGWQSKNMQEVATAVVESQQ